MRAEPLPREPELVTGGQITVELDGDPAARRETARASGRISWLWLPAAAVLMVAVMGIVALWPHPSSLYRPPVVEGLSEQPDFAWQRQLDGADATLTVTDRAILLHPNAWRGEDFVVELLDPADGEARWTRDFGEHITERTATRVSARDLPGTDYLSLTLGGALADPQQTLIVNRSDGRLIASREVPPGGVLATTDQGTYVLLREQSPNGYGELEISLLSSSAPDDTSWTSSANAYDSSQGLVLRELGGYLGLSMESSGYWDSGLGEVLSVGDDVLRLNLDGSRPAWFVGNNVVAIEQEALAAYDAHTGEELWRIDDCRCFALEMGGRFFTLRWHDASRAEILGLDPADGSPLWDEPLVSEEFLYAITMADDEFVALRAQEISPQTYRTCVFGFDAETGAAGPERCLEAFGSFAWGGQGQVILWDGLNNLYAMGLSEDEPRWHLELPSQPSQIHVVDGRLVVVDEQTGTVGVLE